MTQTYRPGDRVNGYVLTQDLNWLPEPRRDSLHPAVIVLIAISALWLIPFGLWAVFGFISSVTSPHQESVRASSFESVTATQWASITSNPDAHRGEGVTVLARITHINNTRENVLAVAWPVGSDESKGVQVGIDSPSPGISSGFQNGDLVRVSATVQGLAWVDTDPNGQRLNGVGMYLERLQVVP